MNNIFGESLFDNMTSYNIPNLNLIDVKLYCKTLNLIKYRVDDISFIDTYYLYNYFRNNEWYQKMNMNNYKNINYIKYSEIMKNYLINRIQNN